MDDLIEAFKKEIADRWRLWYGVSEMRDDNGNIDHRTYWVELRPTDVDRPTLGQIVGIRHTMSEFTRSQFRGGAEEAERFVWSDLIAHLRAEEGVVL